MTNVIDTNVIDLAAFRRSARAAAEAAAPAPSVAEILAPLEAAMRKLEAATAQLVAAHRARQADLAAFAKQGAPPELPQ